MFCLEQMDYVPPGLICLMNYILFFEKSSCLIIAPTFFNVQTSQVLNFYYLK